MFPKKLSELDLEVDLNSCEGLDINYLSRIRSHYVLSQHQTMIAQMQFADAKAAALIALIGLVTLRGPIKIEDAINLGLTGYVFLVTAGLGIICALLSIFPRYPSRKVRNALPQVDRWSWPALASKTLTADDFASYVRTAEVSQLLHSVAVSNYFVAAILLSKYRMLRCGFIFCIMAMLILGAYTTGLV